MGQMAHFGWEATSPTWLSYKKKDVFRRTCTSKEKPEITASMLQSMPCLSLGHSLRPQTRQDGIIYDMGERREFRSKSGFILGR
jgi:hypothetical protein